MSPPATSGTPVQNPFPGPQPYRAADRDHFYGREVVARKLASTIKAHRCVALYGPSGAGKSSVMQAAVIPDFEDEYDFRHVTVDGWPADEPPVRWLLYSMYTQLKLVVPADELDLYESVEWTLQRAYRRSDRPILIYLDQIEQLLYTNRRRDEVEDFLDWLDRFVERPRRGLHLVLAMREDYLGHFRDRARGRYRLLENGFRLGPMTVGEIVGAVCTASRDGVPPQRWRPKEMRPLMLQVRTPGQLATDRAEIQTAFAQIVCRALFAQRAEHGEVDGAGTLKSDQAVQAEPILESYLETTLASLGSLRGAAENLMESYLVAADGSRSLLTEEAARASGLLKDKELAEVLEKLEAAAVLRAEQHRGSRYYEIGHDWLASKVFERKQEREARLAAIERERLLEVERVESERKLLQAERATRRARVVVVVVTILALMALATGFYAWRQSNRAVLASQKAAQERDKAIAAQAEAQAARDKAQKALAGEQQAVEDAERATVEALAQKQAADEQRAAAESSEKAAKSSEVRAKKSEKTAKRALGGQRRAAQEAQAQREAAESSLARAERENQRARDASRLAAAIRVLDDDPTSALALLREVEDSVNTRGWTPATVDALQRPASTQVIREHEGYVIAAAFSPDGKKIVTASKDATATLVQLDHSSPPLQLDGHGSPLTDVVYSPDGTMVATSSSDGAIRLWQTKDGSSQQLKGHKGRVNEIAFSPDGKTLASAGNDGTARVWKVDNPNAPTKFKGHASAVRSVTFSPDGSRLVTSSDDGTARVWSLAGAKPVILKGHAGTVYDASFNPNATQVVTAGDDSTARVWSLIGAKPGSTITEARLLKGHSDAVYSAEFAAKGRPRVATASRDNTARLWTLPPSGPPQSKTLRGHTDKVYIARFGPRARTLATVSRDGTAILWSVDGSHDRRDLRGHSQPVVDVQYSPDGKQVVTVSEDRTARTWNVDGKHREIVLRQNGSVHHVGFAGTKVLAASSRGIARIWNISGHIGTITQTLRHKKTVLFLAVGPQGKRAFTGSADGTAKIWSIAGGQAKQLRSIDLGQPGLPSFVRFSEDGRKILTSSTNVAHILGVDDNRDIALRGHHGRVLYGAFSRDGTKVVTTSEDRTANIWNADGTGSPSALRGHEGSVYYASFSSDGAQVVTASWDKTARVWPTSGNSKPLILEGHAKPVRSAEFSHDNKRVVTASDDQTARIWYADGTGDTVALYGHEGAVLHAAFSPDDRLVVTGSKDRTARVWEADFNDPELLKSQIQDTTTVCLTTKQRMDLLGEQRDAAQARFDDCEVLRATPGGR